MDTDTTLEILRDIIAGDEHKHNASDRSEALRIFLADVADTARNSANAGSGRFMPIYPPVSSPSTRN
jgi:hypothetical protein